MIRAEKFELTGVRLVVFTPNHGEFKPSTVLAAVLGKFGKRFDGTVQVLPLPPEIPPDLPRIQLASKDSAWSFSASPSQVVSSWNRKTGAQPTILAQMVKDCAAVIENHVAQIDTRVGRMGMVITRGCRVDKPASVLIDRFCNNDVKGPESPDAPLRNSLNFEIHNHKRYSAPTGCAVNSWVRCRTGDVGIEAQPGVTVEQDINTLSEEMEKRSFTPEQIREFAGMVAGEADSILRTYFP